VNLVKRERLARAAAEERHSGRSPTGRNRAVVGTFAEGTERAAC
jgi:hypothetical protein